MGKQVQLFIGEVQADISDPESLGLALTYEIADIKTIDARRGGQSKTITLPATGTNKQIFGFVEHINSVDALDQTVKPDARIIVDGQTLMEGSIKITDVIIDGKDNITEYKVVLLGDNGSWKNIIKDRNLRDLDFSNQDHTWDKAAIDLSETVSPARDYVYPLISYGRFDIPVKLEIDDINALFNSPGNAELTFDGAPDIGWVTIGQYITIENALFENNNGSHQVKAKTLTTLEIQIDDFDIQETEDLSDAVALIVRIGGVRVENRYPAMNFRSILNKIFLEAGFTVVSDFVDSPKFKNLYMPFTQKSFTQGVGYGTEEKFRVARSVDLTTGQTVDKLVRFDLDSGGALFDNGDNWDTGFNTYTVSKPSRQRFTLSLDIKAQSAQFVPGRTIELIMKRNGSTFSRKAFTVDNDLFPDSKQYTLVTSFIDLQAGDVIEAFTRMNMSIITIKFENSHLLNTPLDDIVPGANVPLTINMPDETQIKWLQGIKHAFNLYFDTNVQSHEVVIEPHDEFYLSEDPENWSSKFDVGDDITYEFLGSELAREVELRYREDSNDAVIKDFNNREVDEFAAHTQPILNKFTGKDKTAITNPIFAATIMGWHPQIGFNQTMLPRMWSKYEFYPEWETAYLPRVLHYVGVQSMINGESWIWENTLRTDYPKMYFFDLSVDNENNLRFDDTTISNGLFQKHYRNTFKEIDESRIITALVDLNDKDINNLSFRKIVFVELEGTGVFLKLRKIHNYNPLNREKTKVEFLKVVTTVDAAAVITIAAGGPSDEPTEELAFEIPPEHVPTPADEQAPGDSIPGFDGEGNLGNPNAGNVATAPKTVMYGVQLIASKPDQVVIGKNNVPDPDALFIIGGGNAINPKNLLKIDSDGNLQTGDSQTLFTEVEGVEVPMTYEDGNGNVQTMKI